VDRPGGHPGVEALLLHGRPDHHPAVAPGHHVHLQPANVARAHRLGGRAAQVQQLALDRPHRRQRLGGQPAQPPAPAARGQHHRPGRERLPAGQDHPGDPVAPGGQLGHPAGHQPDPGPLAGHQQGLDQGPVVDLVVAGGEHAAADAGMKARLELAALAAA
jgi:hypothetical protein